MPKHIQLLIGILAVFAMLFVAGKMYFPPKSFGVYGHYRAASVEDIAAPRPAYLNPDAYSAAYPKEYETWSAGIHKVVKCQICHTTVGLTVNMASLGGAASTVASAGLPPAPIRARSASNATRKLPGRPDSMPQIDVDSHSKGQACIACHNPHSPLFSKAGEPIIGGGTAGAGSCRLAAGKKVSATCAGCHGPGGVSATRDVSESCLSKTAVFGRRPSTEFQSGKRANPVMSGIAKSLSAADIQNVAAYFAGLSCK